MASFPVAAESNIGPKTAQVISTLIPARGFSNILQAGTNFYLVQATAAVLIAPFNGSANTYTQGTGMAVDITAKFDGLQVSNPNAFSVVLTIFVGFGGYIDNRLIQFNPLNVVVAYPTYPAANVSATVLIPDLSGQAITDINGKTWLALQRQAIYISNIETASVYYLRNSGAGTGTGLGAVVAIQPGTDIVVPFNGNFSLNNGVSNVNAIISEAYLAIAPTQ